MKKKLLLIVTIFMIVLGITLVVYIKNNPDLLEQNKQSAISTNTYTKNESQIQESTKNSLEQESFEKNNLEYKSTFVSFSIPTKISEASSQSVIENIVYNSSSITIFVQQAQKCGSDSTTAAQAGFYNYTDGELVLYNMVNLAGVTEPTDCLVKLEYKISGIDLNESSNLKVIWQKESGEQFIFPICFYDSKPYNNDDVFGGMDKCTTCTCLNGVVTCQKNDKCVEKESKKEVEVETKIKASI